MVSVSRFTTSVLTSDASSCLLKSRNKYDLLASSTPGRTMDPERVRAYLQVACAGLGFDIGEVWWTSKANGAPAVAAIGKAAARRECFSTSRKVVGILLCPMYFIAGETFARLRLLAIGGIPSFLCRCDLGNFLVPERDDVTMVIQRQHALPSSFFTNL